MMKWKEPVYYLCLMLSGFLSAHLLRYTWKALLIIPIAIGFALVYRLKE